MNETDEQFDRELLDLMPPELREAPLKAILTDPVLLDKWRKLLDRLDREPGEMFDLINILFRVVGRLEGRQGPDQQHQL